MLLLFLHSCIIKYTQIFVQTTWLPFLCFLTIYSISHPSAAGCLWPVSSFFLLAEKSEEEEEEEEEEKQGEEEWKEQDKGVYIYPLAESQIKQTSGETQWLGKGITKLLFKDLSGLIDFYWGLYSHITRITSSQ